MIAPLIDELADDYVGKAKVCKLNVDDCGRIAQSYDSVQNDPLDETVQLFFQQTLRRLTA